MDQAGLTRRIPDAIHRQLRQGLRGAFGQRGPSQCRWLARFTAILVYPPMSCFKNRAQVIPDDIPDIEWTRFPLKSMAKAGWIPDVPNLRDRAEEFISRLMEDAGGRAFAAAPLYRKNDSRRINAKTDDVRGAVGHGAGRCWPRARGWWFRESATEGCTGATGQSLPPHDSWRQIRLSWSVLHDLTGSSQGSSCCPVWRLELGTCESSAQDAIWTAQLLRLKPDGRPVIGLTLRYDRIDNFWYTLGARVGSHRTAFRRLRRPRNGLRG